MTSTEPNRDDTKPPDDTQPPADTKPKQDAETNKEDTQPKQAKNIKFSYFEPVAGIIFAVVAAVIFLGFPNIIAVVFVDGPLIPTFDEVVIRSLWLPIILWALLRIGVEIAYLVERCYTRRLAIITMAGNSLAFISTLIIFIPYRIVNVEYIDWIHTYFSRIGAEWFGEILARPNVVIIVIMLIGLILDSITVIRKGNKAKKQENDENDVDESAEDVSYVEKETSEEVI